MFEAGATFRSCVRASACEALEPPVAARRHASSSIGSVRGKFHTQIELIKSATVVACDVSAWVRVQCACEHSSSGFRVLLSWVTRRLASRCALTFRHALILFILVSRCEREFFSSKYTMRNNMVMLCTHTHTMRSALRHSAGLTTPKWKNGVGEHVCAACAWSATN